MKYGYRYHRSTIQDSLSTKVYINEYDFKEKSKNYKFYGYDHRCRQLMFIRNDMERYYTEPTWLFIELEENEK